MKRNMERNHDLYRAYLEGSYLRGETYKEIGEQFNISASRAFRIVQYMKKLTTSEKGD